MSDNTARSFRDKWENNTDAFYAETLREGSDTQRWILERNGFSSADAFGAYLADRGRILDAGCGNGRVTALLKKLAPESAELVGIDLVGADVAREHFKDVERVRFDTRDLLGDLSGLGEFDFIYCQEVLHHTADPARAFHNLRTLLAPGGEIAIYVYKQKAPAREFVDDYVRGKIAELPYEEAMKHCAQITEFGRALTEAELTVKVPPIDVLGIDSGTYDVQRLIYHFFAKCYWNPNISQSENVMVNYDWYHPQLATRHTLGEVEEWFEGAGLDIVHRTVDFYGITVRGRVR
ncbi:MULTISPECIES: class I SAM-dependent methyltransferase [unclassified Agrobacterium]|uniref:class I SAM-dependent methyltransferase n=1 Tax=unclassified Agrobacterium TaxID=2632611 RepID=UPI00083CDDD5|nr:MULTISPECIES: class I SAM-dependent methyltransferase [unclassified Agrobacterium]AOG12647.1 methyltransferase small domain protein [Agrobacterium sp. RAC06]